MKNSKGSALILVILIVSLISLLVVLSSNRLSLNIKNSAAFSSDIQSYWFAMAIESSANDFLQTVKNLDQINFLDDEDLIKKKINVNIDGVNIQGKLKDLNSCFNVNLLVIKKDRKLLEIKKL